MSESREHKVHSRRVLFDDFFRLVELVVSHEQADGKESDKLRRLVFERGDAVAVLLYNSDSDDVVLVNQFRPPTLDKGLWANNNRREGWTTGDGWIVELVAGMIPEKERADPRLTAVRETKEETGYEINKDKLQHVGTFFTSPGGTSERIFLYFAKVSGPRPAERGGIGDEDIEIKHISSKILFDLMKDKLIEDLKLLIGAQWLQDYLRKEQEQISRTPLSPSTCVKHQLKNRKGRFIGYHTGRIHDINGVDAWVNSENEDMIMDRYIGRSISASIRWLGSEKNADGDITDDTIAKALERQVALHEKVGTMDVLVTKSGALRHRQVHRIYHVATVKRGLDQGQAFRAVPEELPVCVTRVLERVDKINRKFWTRSKDRSILFPILGSGDGNLSLEIVAPDQIKAAVDYLESHPDTLLTEIYFLAFTERHKRACDQVFRQLQKYGRI